jgi:glycosyltransferase involved in cell wall biosynthesis
LINAYLQLKAQSYPLPKLVIAGPGMDTAYGMKMKKLASGSADIYFPGMLTGELKWGAFYGCDAFILISHQENFGIAVAEAMACGKPVLISDKVNIWREIVDGGGGIVSEDSQDGAITQLKNWCGLNDEQRVIMGNKAKKVFESRFGIDSAAIIMKETLFHQN